MMFKSKQYSLELTSIEKLNSSELDFLLVIFNGLSVGSVYEFKQSDYSRAASMSKYKTSQIKAARSNGYRELLKKINIIYAILVTLLFADVVALFVLSSVYLLGDEATALAFVMGFLAFMLLIFTMSMHPLTAKGRELKDYLLGLKRYIKLAETDRIKFLQSPEGAERNAIDTDDSAKMIVLYERVLPYAVLFGVEKQWSKQLAEYYKSTNTLPVWYVGTSAFNAESFGSSLSSFSSSVASSSSFSSSSGSGGGGSAGGGGGGGGGGGR